MTFDEAIERMRSVFVMRMQLVDEFIQGLPGF